MGYETVKRATSPGSFLRMALSKKQDVAAKQLVQDMTATSREQCRLLGDIDAMLYQAQLGLEELLRNKDADQQVAWQLWWLLYDFHLMEQ